MISDKLRLNQVMADIGRIKARPHPAIVGTSGNYRIVDRAWANVAETSKLAILQGSVDWSGVTNRDQAHILLGEIDPGKIPDAQRNRLVEMAAGPRMEEQPRGAQLKALFAEWTADYAAAKERDEGLGR